MFTMPSNLKKKPEFKVENAKSKKLKLKRKGVNFSYHVYPSDFISHILNVIIVVYESISIK